MAEKPILFNTQMVKAILNGTKTQTRRLIKPQPPCTLKQMTEGYHAGEWHLFRDNPMLNPTTGSPWGAQYLPQYQVGDVLWVRETWVKDAGRYMYRANYSDTEKFYMNGREIKMAWRPSIHMPREAARLFLRVTGVRAEPLNDILEADAIAEGFTADPPDDSPHSSIFACYLEGGIYGTARIKFADLWEQTLKKQDRQRYGWNSNPWVWVYKFERMEKTLCRN